MRISYYFREKNGGKRKKRPSETEREKRRKKKEKRKNWGQFASRGFGSFGPFGSDGGGAKCKKEYCSAFPYHY